jgi:hypothetical protein
MFGKVLSCGMIFAILGAAPVFADLAGPAELPPSSYKGQQYIDSRGCTFLRAGYGGQVTWVPRVSRDRKQVCGAPPSGRAVDVAEPAPRAAPEPVSVAAAPAPKAAAPKPEAIRPVTVTEKAATGGVAVAAPTGNSGYRLACPAENPVAERYEVQGGGSKVLCTRGDGTLVGATFPKLVAGDVTGSAAGHDAYATGAASGKSARSAKNPVVTPPAGYKLAWDDDRLNPNRGKQTVDGFLAMDEIWTRTTPAELREDSKVKRKRVTIIVRTTSGEETRHDGYVLSSKDGKRVVQIAGSGEILVTKSAKAVAPKASATKTAKAPADAAGRFLVQVGTFGVKSNAEGAAGRLKGLGLPVARGKLNGGALTVVYAGPFASAGEARQALSAARGLGFGDARIVQ